jgi:hypothetical protein
MKAASKAKSHREKPKMALGGLEKLKMKSGVIGWLETGWRNGVKKAAAVAAIGESVSARIMEISEEERKRSGNKWRRYLNNLKIGENAMKKWRK